MNSARHGGGPRARARASVALAATGPVGLDLSSSANGDMRFKSNHGDLIHLLDLSLQESKLRHT